jgi:hypothetical protein
MKLIKLFCVSILMVFVSAVYAEPATVGIGTNGCILFDGDGNGVISDEVQWVVANNARGNSKLTCRAYGVVNNQGQAVQFKEFACSTFAGATTRSRNVISDLGDGTGDSTLTCFTPDKD